MSSKKLEVELVRSVIGTPEWMRVIVRTLGLRRIRHKVILPDNGATRGAVHKVKHLVKVRPVEDTANG